MCREICVWARIFPCDITCNCAYRVSASSLEELKIKLFLASKGRGIQKTHKKTCQLLRRITPREETAPVLPAHDVGVHRADGPTVVYVAHLHVSVLGALLTVAQLDEAGARRLVRGAARTLAVGASGGAVLGRAVPDEVGEVALEERFE